MVLGHAYETEGRREPIPAGSHLVLTEECGMYGTIPDQYYTRLGDPAVADLFADPVGNRVAIERILGRRIRIYRPGQMAPVITVSLTSSVPDRRGVYNPSGIHRLPLRMADVTMDGSKRGEKRYETRSLARSYQGSLLPFDSDGPRIRQHTLMDTLPGVHYNFLCRVLEPSSASASSSGRNLESEIKAIFANELGIHPPDIFTPEGFNVPRTALNVLDALDQTRLTAEQKESAARVRERIERVLRYRRLSGSPLQDPVNEDLVRLLAQRYPPHARRVASMIAAADAASLDRPERHSGHTPLMIAALRGSTAAVSALLARGTLVEVKSHDETTALGYAVSGSHPDVTRLLLTAGANPNVASDDGVTPLMIAAAQPTEKGREILRSLLAAGADTNAIDEDGDSALGYAVGYPQESILSALLAAGANAGHPNKKGETPLMLALEDGQLAVARVLLESGADLSLRARSAKGTALGYAVNARADDIAMALIRKGAPVPRPGVILKKLRDAHLEESMPALMAFSLSLSSSSSSETRRKRSTRKRS